MHRKIAVATLSVCLAVAGMSAHAAIGNPAGDSPLTPDSSASPKKTNNADQLFIQLVGVCGQAEVELGDIAAIKGSADSVKKFGQRMSKDHNHSNHTLEKIAQDHDIGISSKKDPDHERQRKHLSDLRGSEFDREYMRTQIADHQRTALLLQWEIGSGQNAALKEYAADTLVDVLEHLSIARQTLDELVTPK